MEKQSADRSGSLDVLMTEDAGKVPANDNDSVERVPGDPVRVPPEAIVAYMDDSYSKGVVDAADAVESTNKDDRSVAMEGMIERLANEKWLPELNKITEQEIGHQLHAARYYVHKLRVKQYHDEILRGMPPTVAKEYYRLAMENYDEMMKSSANGCVTDADQIDMTIGFPYADDGTLIGA